MFGGYYILPNSSGLGGLFTAHERSRSFFDLSKFDHSGQFARIGLTSKFY